MEQLKTTLIPYGGGVYAIDQQMVRAFLIVGEKRALLLDAGAQRIDMPAYIRELASLPVELVLTHGDGDHIANMRDFSDVYVHEGDMDAVRSQEHCGGAALHPLAEGDVFDLGGRELKALYTPGHTAGSVCLLDEANRILFSGDTVSYGPVFMFGAGRDMPEYLRSLKRLQRMRDEGVFTTVYCCHNLCPIPADTLDELIACVTGILDKTIAGTPADMPFPTEDRPLIGRFGNCSILFA